MMAGIAFIVFLPQMTYWHLTTGKWFTYSYSYASTGPEGFDYWKNPQIFKVLFGVVSGWYIYSPVMILSLAGLVWMLLKKQTGSLAILIVFLIILYINSSWWCYSFDCAFGYRSFIEFYALFAIAIAILLQALIPSEVFIRTGIIIVLAVFFSYLNIRMSLLYNWDPCWCCGKWNWKNYAKVVHYALKGGTCEVNVHQLDP